MQKVLQATSKAATNIGNLAGPAGFVTKRELQESLSHLGANLSQTEFDTLMISAAEKGLLKGSDRVEVGPFADLLRKQVTDFNRELRDEKQKAVSSSARYTDTFRSSLIFGDGEHDALPEAARLSNGSGNRIASRTWTKLKCALQNNSDKLLTAFSSGEIPLSQLKKQLSREGLPLGDEDVEAIKSRIDQRRYDGDSSTVSLDDICDVAGLNKRYDGNKLGLMIAFVLAINFYVSFYFWVRIDNFARL